MIPVLSNVDLEQSTNALCIGLRPANMRSTLYPAAFGPFASFPTEHEFKASYVQVNMQQIMLAEILQVEQGRQNTKGLGGE